MQEGLTAVYRQYAQDHNLSFVPHVWGGVSDDSKQNFIDHIRDCNDRNSLESLRSEILVNQCCLMLNQNSWDILISIRDRIDRMNYNYSFFQRYYSRNMLVIQEEPSNEAECSQKSGDESFYSFIQKEDSTCDLSSVEDCDQKIGTLPVFKAKFLSRLR